MAKYLKFTLNKNLLNFFLFGGTAWAGLWFLKPSIVAIIGMVLFEGEGVRMGVRVILSSSTIDDDRGR